MQLNRDDAEFFVEDPVTPNDYYEQNNEENDSNEKKTRKREKIKRMNFK